MSGSEGSVFNFSGSHELGILISSASVVTELLKIEGVMDRLSLLIQMITPQTGRAGYAGQFIESLVKCVSGKQFRSKGSFLTQAECDRFVSILLPAVKIRLFGWHVDRKNAISDLLLTDLLELSYEQVRQELFLYAVDHLIDSEMRAFTIVCLRMVSLLLPFVFSGEHFWENAHLIPKIVESVLFDISSNSRRIRRNGYGLLDGLCSVIFVSEQTLNGEMRVRQVSTALYGNFEEFVRTAAATYSMLAQQNDDLRRAADSESHVTLGPVFYGAFESKLIQKKLDFIFDMIEEGSYQSYVFLLLDGIARAHFSLIPEMARKIEEKARKAPPTSKCRWFVSMAQIMVACDEMSEVIEPAIRVVKMAIESDVQDKFSSVLSVVMKMLWAWGLPWATATRCDGFAENHVGIWGRLPRLREIDPKLRMLSADQACGYCLRLWEALAPAIDNLEKYDLKDQLDIVELISQFGTVMLSGANYGTMECPRLHPGFADLLEKILKTVDGWLNSGSNLNLIAKVIVSLASVVKLCDEQKKKVGPTRGRKGTFSTAVRAWVSLQRILNSVCVYVDVPGLRDLIKGIIIKYGQSSFARIQHGLGDLVRAGVVQKNPELWDEIADHLLNVVEKEGRTEGNVRAVLGFALTFPSRLLSSPERFKRMVLAILATDFKVEWKMDIPLVKMIGIWTYPDVRFPPLSSSENTIYL
jgi:hypothetical protein